MTAFRKMLLPILAAAALVGIADSASADDRFDMTPNAGVPEPVKPFTACARSIHYPLIIDRAHRPQATLTKKETYQ